MKFNIRDIPYAFESIVEKITSNARIIFLSMLASFLLTIAAGTVVFFLSLKGSEQVMVPNVQGKDLSVALLEMQAKELYPKIQLKYSDSAQDKGHILEQSPAPGSIVKAGRRINLTVSRGIIMDTVENFTGRNIDDIRMHLQSLFTSMAVPLLTIKEPLNYRFSAEPAGTVLEQNPPPDTALTGPIVLELVVSRGPENDRVKVPSLIGANIQSTLSALGKTSVLFDFTERAPEGSEVAGTVVSMLPSEGSTVNAWSRVSAVIAMPVNPTDGKIYGIFTETLPLYPYPFQVTIDTVSPKGERSQLVSLKHPGGLLTVPYALSEGTTIILNILNKEVGMYEVHEREGE